MTLMETSNSTKSRTIYASYNGGDLFLETPLFDDGKFSSLVIACLKEVMDNDRNSNLSLPLINQC